MSESKLYKIAIEYEDFSGPAYWLTELNAENPQSARRFAINEFRETMTTNQIDGIDVQEVQSAITWHKWPDELPPADGWYLNVTRHVDTDDGGTFFSKQDTIYWDSESGWRPDYSFGLFIALYWMTLPEPPAPSDAPQTPYTLREWQRLADEMHGGNVEESADETKT